MSLKLWTTWHSRLISWSLAGQATCSSAGPLPPISSLGAPRGSLAGDHSCSLARAALDTRAGEWSLHRRPLLESGDALATLANAVPATRGGAWPSTPAGAWPGTPPAPVGPPPHQQQRRPPSQAAAPATRGEEKLKVQRQSFSTRSFSADLWNILVGNDATRPLLLLEQKNDVVSGLISSAVSESVATTQRVL